MPLPDYVTDTWCVVYVEGMGAGWWRAGCLYHTSAQGPHRAAEAEAQADGTAHMRHKYETASR